MASTTNCKSSISSFLVNVNETPPHAGCSSSYLPKNVISN
jgi:hypothetical protein